MHVGAEAIRGIESDRLTLGVAVGDLVAIVGVLTVGMLRHDVNPLEAPGHAILVIAPFLLGWVLVAPLVGAYAADTLASSRGIVATGVGAWVVAALVGATVRSVPAAYAPGSSPPVFVAVVTGFGALAVGGWRVLLSVAR